MNSRRSELLVLLVLIVAGVALYAVRWVIFATPEYHSEMWRFLLGDVAFLFLQVAIVTMLIDRILRVREKRAMLQKLNMVIGAFFSEVGTELLGKLAVADSSLGEVRDQLVPAAKWQAADYGKARAAVDSHSAKIDLSSCDLYELKAMLVREKPFLLGLLGNQALLEHESFTELLWAVTHLAEELDARGDFEGLPPADRIHLAGDVKRAFTLLTGQWLEYVRHLQTAYPYLFSLAVRLNPLDPGASVTVQE
ncbi:MAG: hypothetical protein P4L93_05990 [Coriobacteriia bacterium]|nr:hypothetical protein [Coriobacteriia bacterium]